MNDIIKPEAQSVTERLAALPPEVQALFADPENGTPDNISKAGCLALARLGKNAWNAWREAFPVTGKVFEFKNFADFAGVDFRSSLVDFSGFVFGRRANFNSAQWGDGADFQGAQWGRGVNFQDAQWGDGANFQGAQWGSGVNFQDAQWGDGANFQGAQWGDWADFQGAKWGDLANFQDATWGARADFQGVQWGDEADFQGAQWGSRADFQGAQWGNDANFQGAKWGSGADFKGAQWGGWADLQGAKWNGKANFQGASWDVCRQYYRDDEHYQAAKKWAEERGLSPDGFQSISFAGVHFAGDADFSNRKFAGNTDFGRLSTDYQNGCVLRDENGRALFDEKGELLWEVDPGPRRPVLFEKAPKFHGCELHQDTTFDGAVFPPASGSDEAARAYRTLKLAFSKQQALREEQRFFKLEMEEEALREQGLKRRLFWAYKYFSDYGFSVRLPLYWALRVSVFLFLVYGALSWVGNCLLADACEFAPQWLTFSLLHTLPVPGVDKMAEAAGKVFLPTGGWWELGVSMLVILHKAVVIAALFLAGLALRNLFRLK